MKNLLMNLTRRFGFEVTKTRESYLRDLFQRTGFDILVDVGANRGQFICLARASGYKGPIVAFEPIAEHRPEIERYGDVRVVTSAVGEAKGELTLNLYSQTDFSSQYELNSNYSDNYRPPSIVEKRIVPVTTLDSEPIEARQIFAKIDTQGSEAAVLRGATSLLSRVDVLFMEVPFLQIYGGGSTVSDLFSLTRAAGLYPARFWANSITPSGAWVDGDVAFVRHEPK